MSLVDHCKRNCYVSSPSVCSRFVCAANTSRGGGLLHVRPPAGQVLHALGFPRIFPAPGPQGGRLARTTRPFRHLSRGPSSKVATCSGGPGSLSNCWPARLMENLWRIPLKEGPPFWQLLEILATFPFSGLLRVNRPAGVGGPAGEEDLDGLDRPIQDLEWGFRVLTRGWAGEGERGRLSPLWTFSFPLKCGFLLNSQPLTDGDCSSLSRNFLKKGKPLEFISAFAFPYK